MKFVMRCITVDFFLAISSFCLSFSKFCVASSNFLVDKVHEILDYWEVEQIEAHMGVDIARPGADRSVVVHVLEGQVSKMYHQVGTVEFSRN